MSYYPRMADRSLGRHYLREWREHRGLSLRKLADRMEIEPGVPLTSHANIGRVETFQQPYTQELLEAAAAALECSVTDLLTVNPKKEGEVVDLLRLLRTKDLSTVRAILVGLPSALAPGHEPSAEEALQEAEHASRTQGGREKIEQYLEKASGQQRMSQKTGTGGNGRKQ